MDSMDQKLGDIHGYQESLRPLIVLTMITGAEKNDLKEYERKARRK